MKAITLITALTLLLNTTLSAQNGTLYLKGNQKIRFITLQDEKEQFRFTLLGDTLLITSCILKRLVDSIQFYNAPTVVVSATPELNTRENKRRKEQPTPVLPVAVEDTPSVINDTILKEKPWLFTIGLGFNIGNVLEFNNPTGTNKKSFTLNNSLDLGANFKKEDHRIESANEIHYLVGVQKEGLKNGSPIQRVQDDLSSLHDLSIGFGHKNKWNLNIIAKTTTSIFTVYDGDYFKDMNTSGPIKAFTSPYDVVLSPGIKYQPNDYWKISISPYSTQFYGVTNPLIANKGIFITEKLESGQFKKAWKKRLGAEVNIWYDRNIGTWLMMQYRIGIASDYFEKIGKNGEMRGLLITKVKLIGDVYLTHRATMQSNLAKNFFKPYYNQTILLSFAKSL